MAEAGRNQPVPGRESPLHAYRDVVIDATDATIVERPFRPMFVVRADVGDASLREALFGSTGLAWPEPCHFEVRGGFVLAWLGPDEFLLVDETNPVSDTRAAAERGATLRGDLAARVHAITAVGAGFTTLEVAGHGARDVLARGCALDLSSRVFEPGDCLQTTFAKTVVTLLHRSDASGGPRIEMIVRRSYADHVWRWLRANVR